MVGEFCLVGNLRQFVRLDNRHKKSEFTTINSRLDDGESPSIPLSGFLSIFGKDTRPRHHPQHVLCLFLVVSDTEVCRRKDKINTKIVETSRSILFEFRESTRLYRL